MAKPDVDLTSVSPLWLVPIALVTAVTLGVLFGRGTFFLTLAAFALLGAVWVLWQSLQNLTGDAPLTLEEALGLGAPSAEEERKVSVLRALKDLEYERAVGKIDEEDFQRLSAKYRKEAKALLALLDDDLAQARERAELRLRERLAREGVETESADAASAGNALADGESDEAASAGKEGTSADPDDASTERPAEAPESDAPGDTEGEARGDAEDAKPASDESSRRVN